MTEPEALKRVQEINDMSYDDESAHANEDRLHQDFIEFVAKRKDCLGKIARIVLSTKDIRFARWCA